MKTEQLSWTEKSGWNPGPPGGLADSAQLVILFGNRSLLEREQRLEEISSAYPNALVFGCSTGGEILDTRVFDGSLALTAVHFEKTRIASACVNRHDASNSYDIGKRLAKAIDHENLTHTLVLTDGLNVNGSELAMGIDQNLPKGTAVTGGLAGDGMDFGQTCIVYEGKALKDSAGIVGFYGDQLAVGYGSLGGWDPFGPERLVTKSEGNVLFELDGRSALDLYKQYLGEDASGLPASGVKFPLSIRSDEHDTSLVRTILAVSQEEGSVTFAGDVPEGWCARLMKANVDHLVEGASMAAEKCHEAMGLANADLGILISCVGRRPVLKQRIEEEIEAVSDIVGESASLTGFYSYGEIAPFSQGSESKMHNQTMTVTTFRELVE